MTINPPTFNRVTQGLQQRQATGLNSAYTAAQEINALEEPYYQGRPIAYTPDQSKTVYDSVRSLRDRRAEEANDLWREAREAELNGLKNLLADLVAVGTFAVSYLTRYPPASSAVYERMNT